MRTIRRSFIGCCAVWSLVVCGSTSRGHATPSLGVVSLQEKAEASKDGYDLSIAESFFNYWVYPKFTALSSVPVRSPYDSRADASEAASCRESYKRVLDSRKLNVRIALGYFDTSDGSTREVSGVDYGKNFSEDIFAALAFKWVLKLPCSEGLAACGFIQDPLNPHVLTRKVRFPDGRDVDVSVEIRHSSLTPFYHVNTQARAAEQKALTASTSDFFFGGVHAADVLLYIGHARNGGGPDFAPPPLTKDRRVDYSHYKKSRPGISQLLKEMQAPGSKPLLIGLLNCLTEHHFGKNLRQVTESTGSKTGFVLTNGFDASKRSHLTDYDDAMKGSLAIVDGLMKMQCLSGFQEGLDAVMAYEPKMVIRQFLGAKKAGL